ncbi:hypothetical protein Pmani_009765 [Petrolisthes manimaculis]|uniref:WAC domain-containing protein n=1 Tax=Petrolisthes manimaculis TaxID=1843537 RepID=A0AAE1Q3G6_9EUCA|nr:hypothetical protein Pmani_009765 [Petrolisthes manimaculis]
MLWTCEVTGRPNLTYAEAAQSEARARKSLANIPRSQAADTAGSIVHLFLGGGGYSSSSLVINEDNSH